MKIVNVLSMSNKSLETLHVLCDLNDFEVNGEDLDSVYVSKMIMIERYRSAIVDKISGKVNDIELENYLETTGDIQSDGAVYGGFDDDMISS